MYDIYLDKLLLPVAPSKITTKIVNQNKTIKLINEGEVNVLKLPGLTTVDFTFLVPHTAYPFASYKNGFIGLSEVMSTLEVLKLRDEPFQFIVVRRSDMFSTNLSVAIEDYSINEDAKNGLDMDVAIKLKQYKAYGTKQVKVSQQTKLVVDSSRQTQNSPKPKTPQQYTVKAGDCLWNIARQYYGNGSDYQKIAQANKDVITRPNLIHPGDVLTIPK